MGISNLPLNEMFSLGTKDVHPLLYYLIFKVFIKLFGILNIVNLTLIGKVVSLIPFYLITLLSFTKVKKNFGILTAGLFTFCINSMPQLMLYGVELRMYSWALFFITASFIYFIEITKNSNLKNWAILTILTICSAYTHYFASITSFIIYFILLIYIILNNKKMFKNWIISAIIAVLSFIPWLFIVLGQFSEIQGNYWINSINIDTIISYFYFVISPAEIFIKGNELLNPTILGTIFIIAIIILIAFNLKDKNEKIMNNFGIIAILIFILVPLIGIIASINSPVFHHRYMIPALGCFWLGFSILLTKAYNKKEIFIPIIVLILVISIIGTINFIDIEENDVKATIQQNNSLQNIIGSGNVIFYDKFPLYFEQSTYYLPDNHHLSFDSDMGITIKNALTDPGIRGEIANGSKVYYVDGGKSNYQECIDAGLVLEKVNVNLTEKDINEYKIYEIKIDK